MTKMLFLFVVAICVQSATAFVLPEGFLGLWKTQPATTMLGPWSQPTYTFSVSKAPNEDYLFENNLIYDSNEITGYQRFYVEGSGSTEGSLWYCGSLSNFSDSAEITGDSRLNGFKFDVSNVVGSITSVTFCLDSDNEAVMGDSNPFKPDCSFCGCANWTLTYDESSDVLISDLAMGGYTTGSTHVHAEFKKHGPSPTISDAEMPGHGSNFSCDFSDGGRDSVPVDFLSPSSVSGDSSRGGIANPHRGGISESLAAVTLCPHMKHIAHTAEQQRKLIALSASSSSFSSSSAAKKVVSAGSDMPNCYTLNKITGYNLAWELDNKKQSVRITVSAFATNNSTWVAIGFRPMSRSSGNDLTKMGTGHNYNFGMIGADIVAGSVGGGIRTLYAEEYTGAPVPDYSLKISNASVYHSPHEGGRVVMSFTRPLVSGYLLENYHMEASILSPAADIIWAIGSDRASSSSGCGYHNNKRSLRVIEWEDPEISMLSAWKCNA